MSTNQSRVAVQLHWSIGPSNAVTPTLSVAEPGLRSTVFDAYEVSGIDELADKTLSSYERESRESRRLGVAEKDEDGTWSFVPEQELLTRVRGITDTLAAGLLEMERDIPTLCENQRRDGDAFLATLINDARVESRDWVSQLETFCEDLGPNGFERRLKRAGVWEEPAATPTHS